MTKFRLNRTLFFVLVTAFLSMQWSSAHIHLAEHHDHDANHHHEVEVHAHHSISQNDNLSSSTHETQNHSVNVVEIDHQCNTKSGNYFDEHYIALTSEYFHLHFIPLKSYIEATKLNSSNQQYIDYSTIYGRAPPKIS